MWAYIPVLRFPENNDDVDNVELADKCFEILARWPVPPNKPSSARLV